MGVPVNSLASPRFCGVRTFQRLPHSADCSGNDFAVLGVPFDTATSYRPGCRFGPAAIRDASSILKSYHSVLDVDIFEHCQGVDAGDVDIIPGYLDESFERIEAAVAGVLDAGAVPVIMGGDHSISIPVGRALEEYGKKICVIQFDAHLDWTSHVGPLVQGNGSPMRRMSEMDHIGEMVQIGLRGMGSGKKSDYDDARAYGSKLISARELHSKGVQWVLDQIPDAEAYYITFDIDGYDMPLAPGAASPLPGGITYDESMDMLKAICQTGKVVAMDLVEVAPTYDPTGCTERLAALTMLQVIAHAGKKLHENDNK